MQQKAGGGTLKNVWVTNMSSLFEINLKMFSVSLTHLQKNLKKRKTKQALQFNILPQLGLGETFLNNI